MNPDDVEFWLEQRIGYGKASEPFWFIGMEEACGDAAEALIRLGRAIALDDMREFHVWLAAEAGMEWGGPNSHAELFGEEDGRGIVLQRTWNGLIRILLVANGLNPNAIEANGLQMIREYQAQRWGRGDGETLVAEMFPLPAMRGQDWPYGEPEICMQFPELERRETYHAYWGRHRVDLFRELFKKKKPKFVVAYGERYWGLYKRAFGNLDMKWKQKKVGKKMFLYQNTVVLIPHPANGQLPRNLQIAVGMHLRQFVPGN